MKRLLPLLCLLVACDQQASIGERPDAGRVGEHADSGSSLDADTVTEADGGTSLDADITTNPDGGSALDADITTDPDGGSTDGGLDADTTNDIDGGESDAGLDAEASAEDSSTAADLCGDPGRVGGLCIRGDCAIGLECFQIPPNLTVREGFRIPQAQANNDENPTSFTAVATPDPADDLPINFAPGGLCTEQCDATAAVNTCGDCAECSGRLGNDTVGLPLVAFIADADRQFPNEDIGFCRAHCTFDPNGPGDCPSGHTCDPATNLCVEACVRDSQCQSALVVTVDGNYATWRNPYATATCNVTTGRCDWEGPPNPHVGDACESREDCAEDVGVCLRGGTCAETQCNNFTIAPDSSRTGVCDGGRGLCLGSGGNDAAICMQGCNRSDDCLPGNSCVGILTTDGSPARIGDFTGYCFGSCDTVNSGTIGGRPDQLSDCRTGEACDMPPEVAGIDRTGTCRPTCNPTGFNTCGGGQTCVGVSGRSYGFCRNLNSFCLNDGTTDCYAGRTCDNATGTSTYGRCVVPCTSNTQCGGAVCVTTPSHPLRGLCAEPCSGATCGTGRVCEFIAGTSSGYCVATQRS